MKARTLGNATLPDTVNEEYGVPPEHAFRFHSRGMLVLACNPHELAREISFWQEVAWTVHLSLGRQNKRLTRPLSRAALFFVVINEVKEGAYDVGQAGQSNDGDA